MVNVIQLNKSSKRLTTADLTPGQFGLTDAEILLFRPIQLLGAPKSIRICDGDHYPVDQILKRILSNEEITIKVP